MISRWLVWIAATMLLLVGCGTTPGRTDTAAPLPPSAASAQLPAAAADSTQAEAADRRCREGVSRMVQPLSEPVRLTLFVTRGLPKLDRFVDGLARLLAQLEKASGGKLAAEVVVADNEADRQRAEDNGLQEAVFGEAVEDAGVATIKRGYLGLMIDYRTERDVIALLSPDQGLGVAFQVANKIRGILARADGLRFGVGVVAKKGLRLTDPDLVAPPEGGLAGPTVKGIVEQAFPFYELADVDLKGGERPIDPDLRGIVVLQSDEDWTDAELVRIDEFMMRGNKALLVVAGAVNLRRGDRSMKGTVATRRLDVLLGGYGIELAPLAVLDPGSGLQLPVATGGGGMVPMTAPGVAIARHDPGAAPDEQTLERAFVGFSLLDEVAFPYPSVLVPHPEKQPGAKLEVVARTTAASTVDPGPTLDLSVRAGSKPTEPAGQRVIAVALEGELTSAFAGRSVAGVDIKTAAAPGSRVAVISSSQFFANPFAHATNPPRGEPPTSPPVSSALDAGAADLQSLVTPYAQAHLTTTILAFKNLLDWMVADPSIIACNTLVLPEPGVATKSAPTSAAQPPGG